MIVLMSSALPCALFPAQERAKDVHFQLTRSLAESYKRTDFFVALPETG
jgi:type II secretory pathway component PulL